VGASLAFAVALFMAGPTAGQRGRADFVMMDSKCVTIGSVLGQEDNPRVIDGAKILSLCWRTKERVTCGQGSQDGSKMLKAKVAENKYVVAGEESPRMILHGTDSDTTIFIDWSMASYVLAQTYLDVARGLVMQKHCSGNIMTGAALEQILQKQSGQDGK
jgi:hypothetical protein